MLRRLKQSALCLALLLPPEYTAVWYSAALADHNDIKRSAAAGLVMLAWASVYLMASGVASIVETRKDNSHGDTQQGTEG